MINGIAQVVIAMGSNNQLRYKMEGNTLILWMGEMFDHAPPDSTLGHIGAEGDSFQITLTEENPDAFMPTKPSQLQ